MQRVPGLRGRGDEVGAGVELGEFVSALIVRHGVAKFDDAAHADLTIFTIKRNRGLANRLSQLVENLAGKHGGRDETQYQMFGIQSSAGHDRGRESLVLVIESWDKTALCSLQRILSGADLLEIETAIVGSNHPLGMLTIPGIHDGDTSAGQRVSADCIHDGSRDAKGCVRRLALRRG